MIKSIAEQKLHADNNEITHFITHRLKRTKPVWFTLYVSLAAFGLYTCVYAFRKTFAAATFDEVQYLGISYKVWLVTFQVCGYALSKFAGIRIIAELMPSSRSKSILITVCIAWLSWLLFGFFAAPYNLIFLFINGIALGLIWGMIFGFLEGRRVTEVLGAALSISFIFSSGLCRTAGGYLLHYFPEKWMPFAASCIFFVPLLVFLFLLDKIPPPTTEDEIARTKRHPMNARERKHFINNFLPGIVLFIVAYMMLTAFRDFRDNFAAEVWQSIGYENSPAIYTKTEIPVSLGVFVIMSAVMLVRNNRTALMLNHLIIMAGMVLIGVSTFLFQLTIISPILWTVLVGFGLYLGYVPFNSIFFDRLLATFQYAGTVGFIMYVADAFGYLGSVGVLFLKEFSHVHLGWLEFLMASGYFISVAGTALILGSMLYFNGRYRQLAPHR